MTGVIAAVAAVGGLRAVASPSSVSGFGVQTSLVTVTVTGGVAPYTHSWVKDFGDALFAQSPNGASTRFTGSVPSAEVFSASFYDQVTDAVGQTTRSNSVTADLTGA